VVSADGGQTDLIHACILADGPANLRIVGANEACDPGTTPLHWSGESFEPDEVIPPPPAPEDPAAGTEKPKPKVQKKLYATFGVKAGKLKNVKKTLGPSVSTWKEMTVSCPASHPLAFSVKTDWVIHDPGGLPDPWSEYVKDAGWHAKTVRMRAYRIHDPGVGLPSFQVAVNWTFHVTLSCAKLTTGAGNAVAAAQS